MSLLSIKLADHCFPSYYWPANYDYIYIYTRTLELLLISVIFLLFSMYKTCKVHVNKNDGCG